MSVEKDRLKMFGSKRHANLTAKFYLNTVITSPKVLPTTWSIEFLNSTCEGLVIFRVTGP